MKPISQIIFFLFLANSIYSREVKHSELASAKKGEYNSYLASDGAVYKIGDRLKIGVPSSNKTFAYIMEGDGVVIPIKNLTAASSGQETEIKKVWVVGNQRAGFSVSLRTKGITGLSNYTIQLENAIATGEVKGFGMTSDQALIELKKAKDKLDLGLISQEDYDKIKAELSKYIK